jgi:hypothetical protein
MGATKKGVGSNALICDFNGFNKIVKGIRKTLKCIIRHCNHCGKGEK